MYKNYIFDLYGTLIDINTDESKKSLWEKISLFYGFHGANYTPLEYKKNYLKLCKLEEDKLSAVDYPELDLLNVFRQLFEQKKVDVNHQLVEEAGKVFRILSLKYIKLYDGVIELLEELRRRGKSIYLLSNAQKVFTEPEMRMLKLYDYFDGVMLSSDQGCKKPSTKFYDALMEKYQLDTKESIMIGNDAIADILGARKAGLATLYIHSNLSPELEGELVSNYSIMDGNVGKIQEYILRS